MYINNRLFYFVFCFYASVEAAALRSIVLRYAGVPIATRVFFFFFFFFFLFFFSSFFLFVYLEMSLFPSTFCTISAFSSYVEYVVRSFIPDGVFSTL